MPRPDRTRLAATLSLAALLAACGGSDTAPPPPGSPAAPTTEGVRPDGAACRDPGLGPEPDAAALRAFVRRRSRELRDCYQRALKRDEGAGGKATLRFTIGTCGELSRVEVVARSGKVGEAGACVARAVRSWRLPFRPAAPVAIEYPLAFSASM